MGTDPPLHNLLALQLVIDDTFDRHYHAVCCNHRVTCRQIRECHVQSPQVMHTPRKAYGTAPCSYRAYPSTRRCRVQMPSFSPPPQPVVLKSQSNSLRLLPPLRRHHQHSISTSITMGSRVGRPPRKLLQRHLMAQPRHFNRLAYHSYWHAKRACGFPHRKA